MSESKKVRTCACGMQTSAPGGTGHVHSPYPRRTDTPPQLKKGGVGRG